ncbi:hypothetical protein ACH4SK_23190 [Streptomyces inhibens]|uniref:hypothetical protein n=1 Tax=Streptomyces inhibens TaxID=2293571 RepID=UPI0037B8BAE8
MDKQFVRGISLTVAVAAARHEVDEQAERVGCRIFEGVDLVERRDGDLPRDVLGRDDTGEGILRDCAFAASVEENLLQSVEGVLLRREADVSLLHRHDEVLDNR